LAKGKDMAIHKNQFGVPLYPDNDARRLFVLLAAVDLLERPTLTAISDLTSLDKQAIDTGVHVLQQQYGVDIHRIGETYRINSWGNVLNRNGVMNYLKA
jgi:hypothetical protein